MSRTPNATTAFLYLCSLLFIYHPPCAADWLSDAESAGSKVRFGASADGAVINTRFRDRGGQRCEYTHPGIFACCSGRSLDEVTVRACLSDLAEREMKIATGEEDAPQSESIPSNGQTQTLTQTKALKKQSQQKKAMAAFCKGVAQACRQSCAQSGSGGQTAARKAFDLFFPIAIAATPVCDNFERQAIALESAANEHDKAIKKNIETLKNTSADPKGNPDNTGPTGDKDGTGNKGDAKKDAKKDNKDSKGGGFDPSSLMNALNKPKETEQPPQVQPPQACTENPWLAGCQTQAEKEETKPQPLGELQPSSSPEGPGNFNLDNPLGNPSPSPYGSDEPPKFQPATVNTVPNGGGGMPGGGGGGSPASLGSSGGGSSYAGGRGTNTDILHGERSGGASQTNASMNMQTGGGGGGYSYGGGRDSGGSGYEGLDLRQFLPGGKRDPTRKVAGLEVGGPRVEIQSKDSNIWNRITRIFRTRCNEGRLRDCVP